MQKKFRHLIRMGMGLFLLINGAIAVSQNNREHPNILFIAVDDLKPTIGCYGDSIAITPEIDRIANRGTIFTSNYCQQAICAPSRISLFTGMRPDYTGVLDLRTLMRDVNPDIVTIPEYFKKNGYITAGLGKLMHGAKGNDPQSWTIPYRENEELEYADGYKYPANGRYQSSQAQELFQKAKLDRLNWKETNDLFKSEGAFPSTEFMDIPDDAYTDGAIASEGIALLEEFSSKDQPFFLALGFMKPHLPFVAPEKYYALYDRSDFRIHPFQQEAANSPDCAYTTWGEFRGYLDIPSTGPPEKSKQLELIHGYYACISYVDEQIGRVYRKLAELGMAENTLIIIWGDHGWHLGDHGLWCKHTNFEHATKAPLIILDPRLESVPVSSAMTEFVDIFPTLCELAGVKVQESLHGSSLVPLLKNPGSTVKDYAISQYPREGMMGYSLRDQRYRLTWWIKIETGLDGAYKVLDKELYDYREDPMETISFAGTSDYQKIESQLSVKLEAYIENTIEMAK